MKKNLSVLLNCLRRFPAGALAGVLVFAGCAVGPDYNNYEWKKPGGTMEERNRLLAEGRVHAIQAYPDPVSQAQINSEPLNAPSIRRVKREEVIIDFMASKGWKFVPKAQISNSQT